MDKGIRIAVRMACLFGPLVTIVLQHINTEAHRGVFVCVGERVGLGHLLVLTVTVAHTLCGVRSRVCTLVMVAA